MTKRKHFRSVPEGTLLQNLGTSSQAEATDLRTCAPSTSQVQATAFKNLGATFPQVGLMCPQSGAAICNPRYCHRQPSRHGDLAEQRLGRAHLRNLAIRECAQISLHLRQLSGQVWVSERHYYRSTSGLLQHFAQQSSWSVLQHSLINCGAALRAQKDRGNH